MDGDDDDGLDQQLLENAPKGETASHVDAGQVSAGKTEPGTATGSDVPVSVDSAQPVQLEQSFASTVDGDDDDGLDQQLLENAPKGETASHVDAGQVSAGKTEPGTATGSDVPVSVDSAQPVQLEQSFASTVDGDDDDGLDQQLLSPVDAERGFTSS
eukprot:COSAG02_NODE_7202_length_3121_cov_80.140635_2_plen_156_part_01